MVRLASRDIHLEKELLEAGCSQFFGTEPFIRLVHERLSMGEEMYGEAYLGRDNLVEAIEEGPDAAAYALLELQRLALILGEDAYQELRMLTVGIIYAAAQLDLATRAAIRLRREILSY